MNPCPLVIHCVVNVAVIIHWLFGAKMSSPIKQNVVCAWDYQWGIVSILYSNISIWRTWSRCMQISSRWDDRVIACALHPCKLISVKYKDFVHGDVIESKIAIVQWASLWCAFQSAKVINCVSVRAQSSRMSPSSVQVCRKHCFNGIQFLHVYVLLATMDTAHPHQHCQKTPWTVCTWFLSTTTIVSGSATWSWSWLLHVSQHYSISSTAIYTYDLPPHIHTVWLLSRTAGNSILLNACWIRIVVNECQCTTHVYRDCGFERKVYQDFISAL